MTRLSQDKKEMYFTTELWPWCKSFDKGRNIRLKTGAVKSALARVPLLMLIDVRLLRKVWLYMLTPSGVVWGIGVKKDIQDISLMLHKYALFCKLQPTSNDCFVRSLHGQGEDAARPSFRCPSTPSVSLHVSAREVAVSETCAVENNITQSL